MVTDVLHYSVTYIYFVSVGVVTRDNGKTVKDTDWGSKLGVGGYTGGNGRRVLRVGTV